MSIGVLMAAFDALPETDQEKCAAAVDEREWLLASFYCPAGTWLSELFGGDDDEEDQ